MIIINNSVQLKTEGGVLKYVLCRLKDHSAYLFTVSRKSGFLGVALNVPSRDLYIKEHNRDTFFRLIKTIISTSVQLKTESCVSKYGLCIMKDNSVYVSTVSRKSGVLGRKLKMPSRGLYIKEHNRDTF
jgi:hypothetical protein